MGFKKNKNEKNMDIKNWYVCDLDFWDQNEQIIMCFYIISLNSPILSKLNSMMRETSMKVI